MIKTKKNIKVDLDKLKNMRESHGYSVSDIDLTLGYKTPTGYWMLEKGSRQCSIDALYTLSELYGCEMKELLIQVND